MTKDHTQKLSYFLPPLPNYIRHSPNEWTTPWRHLVQDTEALRIPVLMPTLGKAALRKSILDFLVNFMNFGTQQEPGNLSMAVLTEFTDSHPDHLLCYLLESSNILQFWREIFRECGENSGLFFLFNLIVSHSAFIFFCLLISLFWLQWVFVVVCGPFVVDCGLH